MLANVLNNISVYWVADGKKLAQVALVHGGNDLVGTAFSEEVYRAAGKITNSWLADLVNLVKEIKRKPVQRDTFFNTLKLFWFYVVYFFSVFLALLPLFLLAPKLISTNKNPIPINIPDNVR